MEYDGAVSTAGVVAVALRHVKGMKKDDRLSKMEHWLLGAGLDEAREWFEHLVGDERGASAWTAAERQADLCESTGVRLLSILDDGYPDRLRQIPDAPLTLYVKGPTGALNPEYSVAIVGTREPTEFGIKAARESGRVAARMSTAVVSGLALGCDSSAHLGCIDGHGTGVAVLAHGVDTIYPAKNRGLAGELLETGGCLVSEYPIGARPTRWSFVERDRIQSGLSDAVLVVETDVKGGTMHTVAAAKTQLRTLACVAHPDRLLSEPATRGNQLLIEEGAHPIRNRVQFGMFVRDTIKETPMDSQLSLLFEVLDDDF